jgi:hypothetical protein
MILFYALILTALPMLKKELCTVLSIDPKPFAKKNMSVPVK